MAWTGEPRYPDPGADLRAAAQRWRDAVDPAGLRRLVDALPAPRSRLHAPEAMASTDAFILDAWRDAGWAVKRQELRLSNVRARLDCPVEAASRRQRYPDHTYPSLEGTNLVAALAGEERDAIVIVAHHDTVRNSPGADDNGSGVAALIALARLLGGWRFRRTVVLAAPDFEEIGLVGSRYLVAWLRERYGVRAVIVFDAIGYMDPAPRSQLVPGGLGALYPGQVRRIRERGYAGDTVIAIYRGSSLRLVRNWARCQAATIGRERVLLLRDPVDLPVVGRVSRAVPFARNFARSDHWNFWRAGLPAILVSDTANFRNPNYHQAGDTPATLDYGTLASIVAASGLLVERLAQPATPVPADV